MRFNALILFQWLGNGWQFFKLDWECIFEGWMMVGCFSKRGSMLYYFINGWAMVGNFSKYLYCISMMVGWWLADFHIWFIAYWVIKVSVSSKRLRIQQNEWNESTGGRFMMFLFPLISLQSQIHEYVWIQTYLKNSQPWPNLPFIFISLLFAYTFIF